MNHLDPAELVDAAEGSAALAAGARAHLAACVRCREDVEALQATLAEAGGEAVAEPSPLFWDHFASRVAAAVREEPPASRVALLWSGRPAAAWAALLVVVLVSATFTWRATLHAPAHPGAAGAAPAIAAAAGAAAVADPDADHAWGAVRAAVDDLQWDDIQASGMVGTSGTADRAAAELSPEERAELARLLEAEMRRSGA